MCYKCNEPNECRTGRKVCRKCESKQRAVNRSYNYKRESDYKVAWRYKNKDKVRLYNKVDGANRRSGEKINAAIVAKVMSMYDECPGFKRICGARTGLQLEHVIPLEKGGRNVYENLSVLCGTCNKRKGDTMPNELPVDITNQPWYNGWYTKLSHGAQVGITYNKIRKGK